MRRALFVFLFLIISPFVLADEYVFDKVLNNRSISYIPSESTWTTSNVVKENNIILTKKLVESGSGSYSIYNYSDGSLAFALSTGLEILKNNKLIIVDNNLLKFYKLIFTDDGFKQVLLSDKEIKEIFPDREIFKISYIDSDNRVWLHKPFNKVKKILLLNDTDSCFYGLNTKSKNTQDKDFVSLITFRRYGIYNFNHFGEYKGKITFYIR